MKQLLTAIAVAIIISLAVSASANNVAINCDFQGNKCLELSLDKNLGNGLGLFAYANQSKGWSEAYVGPTYCLTANVQVGLGAGIESNQSSARFGGFLWAGKGRASLLVLAEDGGSGPWYRAEVKYNLDGVNTVGLLQEVNSGTGILVEHKLDSTVTLRVRAYGDGRGDVGIKLTF